MAAKVSEASSRLLKPAILVKAPSMEREGERKAADEGPRRAHTLPPIGREYTKIESSSKSTSSQPSREDYPFVYRRQEQEAGGSQWHIKQRHLQARTDERIINHLKKKLNKRILKRLNAYFWTDTKHNEAAHEKDRANRTKEKEQKTLRERRQIRRVDIFSQYNEFGERRQRSTSEDNIPTRRLLEPLPGRSRSMSPNRVITALQETDQNSNIKPPSATLHEDVNIPTDLTPAADLPILPPRSAGSRKSSSILKSRNTSRHSSAQRVTLRQPGPDEDEINNIEEALKKAYDSTDDAVLDNKLELVKDELDSRYPVVSPVPTPQVYRPETRDGNRFTMEDIVNKIIEGRINVQLPTDQKILRIYVSSAITDAQSESGHLMQYAYPVLRQYSLERGCELQMIDLHWGMMDTVTDDHALPQLCLQMLETCQHTRGVHFISFLAQKYGDPMLPDNIAEHEFTDILARVTEDFECQLREMAIGEMKRVEARALEAAQKAREAQEKAEKEEKRGKGASNKGQENHTKTSDKPESDSPEIVDVPETVSDEADRIPDWEDEKKVKAMMGTIRENGTLYQTLARKLTGAAVLNPSLLTDWYKLDMNELTPTYHLQPISSVFKDINHKEGTRRQQAKTAWLEISNKLLQTLQNYMLKLFGKEAARDRFLPMNFLEHQQGVLESDTPDVNCLWFKREITDLSSYLGDSAASQFIDLMPNKATVVPEREIALTHLIESLTQQLPIVNIHRNIVAWGKGGVDPVANRAHRIYLERMCEDFVDAMKTNIDHVTTEQKRTAVDNGDLFKEIKDHVSLCHMRCREFHGRKELMNTMKSYVRSPSVQPLVIFGQSGRGKTSLVCRAAKDVHKWFKGSVSVIMRSVGVTSESVNIRTLLRTILLQLCHIYGDNPAEIPDDYKGIVNDLDNRLCCATEDSPLVIIIDSLDQLSDENDGRKLNWLPKELPPNVHMILSTLPGEVYGVMDSLKRIYGESNNQMFVEVPNMPEEDACIILNHWLRNANRSVTAEQHEALMKAFEQCATPLYLKTIFYECLRWSSWLPASDIKLGNTVGKIATVMFGRLEKDYGELLVRRTLGYITASRNGVMNSEMEDLLSLDDPVMTELSGHSKLTARRCPPVMWLRLRQALSNYVVERSADGVKTLKWFHSQFHESAVQRYLNQRDKAPSYHKAMAEYFQGKWSNGRRKPFPGNEEGEDRYVANQPLYFVLHDEEEEVRHRVYNQRKLNELPWHLLKSQQFPELKTQCLCNFEWVLAKLCATSLRSLLDDYLMALAVEPKDKDLLLLTETLQLSHKVLEVDPKQLASQMVGRLHTIITKDVPVAPQDPLVYPAMHPFFKAAKKGGSFPSLVPSMTCLAEPGGILFDVLSGHTDVITAVTVTTDGMQALTAAKDDTLKLWNLGTGKVAKTIKGVGANVFMLKVACSNSLAITSESTCIRVWNLKTVQCIYSYQDFIDPAILTIAGNGTTLVAFFDGANSMRSWNLEGDIKLLQEVVLEEKSIHKDRSIMVSHGCHNDLVLHAYRSANNATVRNSKTGKLVHKLKCDEKSSSIRSLGTTSEYFAIASKVPFMHLNEIFVLELFDVQKGKYLRTVRGCPHDNVIDLHINSMGSHAMCVIANRMTNTSNIAIWNLETEDHKHLANHVGVSVMTACGDFRYCLTGSEGENTLRVWNLTAMINKPASKLRQSAGIGDIIPMKDNPRYAIGKTIDNSALSVWNVVNSKCKGSAVRIEHGLVGPTDVVLIYNAKVYILTDRALTNASDDSTQQVFQTIHVYDLSTKRYLSRISTYVVPSPPQEYVLLDEDTLMGLNDSRGHFVMWNMSNGRVVDRMKAVHPASNLKYDNTIVEQARERARKRLTTAKMTPWERRAETSSAKSKRREHEVEEEKQEIESVKREKDNAIEQFIISADQTTLVASYYAHHMCVFDIQKRSHVHTLKNPDSMLFLHVAGITVDGSYLVHTNYDDLSKTSYITVWDCKKGALRKRLKNERDVCAVALTDDGSRIVFAKTSNEIRVWHPFETTSLRKLKGYKGMNLNIGTRIKMMDEGRKAVIFAGDVSLWDIDKGEYLSVFTPDMNIECCSLVMNGTVIAFGLRDSTAVIALKYKVKEQTGDELQMGHDMFGEVETSSEEEDSDDDMD